jgi:hypothetical protein
MLTVPLSLLLAITPAVARTPTGSTMVVWDEQSRIHANELLVAPESPNAQSGPDVAALDDFFYVVWREGSRAYGRVIFDGRTLGAITDLGDAYQPPSVAAEIDGFIVVLQQAQAIDVVHVSPIGNVMKHEPMNTSHLPPPPGPAIACDGPNCAMVWLESIASNGCTVHSCNVFAEVRAKRMGSNPIDVASVSASVNHLAIAVKPNGDFAVMWSDGSNSSFALVEGDRVIRSNAVLRGVRPAIGWDGAEYIAARNVDGDLTGTRIGSEWDVSDFTIAASPGIERDADVSMPFVVYEREGMLILRDLSARPRQRAERFR